MVEEIEITTKEQFEKEIAGDKTVLVDFWATWCYPCKMQGQVIESMKNDFPANVKILKVDVDENQDLAMELKIASIPTLIVYKNGEIKNKTIGLTEKEELLSMLR